MIFQSDSKPSRLWESYFTWVLLALICCFAVATKMSSGFEFEGDEGLELQKAFLLQERPDLAASCWNDQPWFLSQVYTLIWRITGVSAAGPRWFTLLCFAGCIYGLRKFLPRDSTLAWWASILILISWPPVLRLSNTAMAEVPAICLAFVASSLLMSDDRYRTVRILASGVLFGIAAQVKLTALLFAPAAAALLLYNSRSWRALTVWAGSLVAAFAVIALWSPHWSMRLLLFPHIASQQANESSDLTFRAYWLLGAPGVILASWLAVKDLLVRRDFRFLIFPALGFLVCLTIHLLHKPWWNYYWIHFALPLSILAGYGFQCSVERLRIPHFPAKGINRGLLTMASVSALLIGFQVPHFIDELRFSVSRQTMDQVPFLQTIKQYRAETRWIFTVSPIFAFEARLLTPPELTVLSYKRFWSKDLDLDGVLKQIAEYRPEQLLLRSSSVVLRPEWLPAITNDYILVGQSENMSHYVIKSLDPEPYRPAYIELKSLGL